MYYNIQSQKFIEHKKSPTTIDLTTFVGLLKYIQILIYFLDIPEVGSGKRVFGLI